MSNFEDLERQEKMIFFEENSEEDKEKIMQKEQQGYNDFIKNLDKKIYKDLGNFPLRYPEKITYPEYINEGDDFILLSIEDEEEDEVFYLFPKILKNKLFDYLKFEEYVKKNPIKFNFSEKGLNSIINTCIFSVLIITIFASLFFVAGCIQENGSLFSIGIILFLTLLIPMVIGAGVANSISVRKNINKYNVFLSKLEKLKFPREFFEDNDVNIYVKPSDIDDKYKELFPDLKN